MMEDYSEKKAYPERINYSEKKVNPYQKSKANEGTQVSLSDGLFYEIEYDTTPMKGVGKYVLKSQAIKAPEKDEIRELFHSMRDIARQNRPTNLNYSRFYDKRVQLDNSTSFYKQAIFMKDFDDAYEEQISFSGYFPYYQMLNYEQLRTYFTWRTQVRLGNVQPTSLSYGFLYVYELLNNIGFSSPTEGLEALLDFWQNYKQYDATLDKYIIRWLKDYHIYYTLPHRFNDFVEANHLGAYFPKLIDPHNSFDLFCSISKYDISKSAFFTEATRELITDCFLDVMRKIRQTFEEAGVRVDEVLFSPTKKIMTWKPFKDALFYQWYTQPNKQVVFSENKIYICKNNEWTCSTIITSEVGKQFVGYVMKQMESVLRKILKYKFKIKVETQWVNSELQSKLNAVGLSIEKIIESAVHEFYRESTKTVVTVDHGELARIRQEALSIQEALIVEEFSSVIVTPPMKMPAEALVKMPAETKVMDKWSSLSNTLSDLEKQALLLILEGTRIKQFVDKHNIMLEVLVDGINEKAFDHIGDNILDDEQGIYDDYIEQVKEMVE